MRLISAAAFPGLMTMTQISITLAIFDFNPGWHPLNCRRCGGIIR